MRAQIPFYMESGRVLSGPLKSDKSYGLTGAFRIQGPCGMELAVISSGTMDRHWEHVSVSCPNRTPNWREMCFVKDLFWDEEEEVMQLHPPKSQYVNCHPFCLHLWKPVGVPIPMPPAELVGPK